jgi:hypothetical protein
MSTMVPTNAKYGAGADEAINNVGNVIGLSQPFYKSLPVFTFSHSISIFAKYIYISSVPLSQFSF